VNEHESGDLSTRSGTSRRRASGRREDADPVLNPDHADPIWASETAGPARPALTKKSFRTRRKIAAVATMSIFAAA
jgi:hypothetical protein